MERPYFSEMLAERRRELGYSIRQASRVLRLREDVLIAFEEGDFEQMPKSGYAQGMVSSYARYLGLDANEVVDAYAKDYERYKRENRRNRSSAAGGRSRGRGGMQQGSVGQPYVGSRGLLPTSGGLAGDMGTFATTRVHVRSDSYYSDEDSEDERPEDDAYPQGRPYTARTPTNTRRAYRSGQSYSRREIETMEVSGYDDLRLGRDAQPYEAASTRAGRRSSRNISNSQRPRVRTRSRQPERGGGRGQRGGRGNRGSNRRVITNNLGIIIAIGAVLALTLIIVLSIGSCVRQDTNTAKTVPVGEASSDSSVNNKNGTGSNSSSSQKNADDNASSSTTGNDAQSTTSKDGASDTAAETSVSVSVAGDAVTWLEVECDGKSDVAETVTGPWQKTYTVEDSITIQAGDTSAVTVVQNGKQAQFESMASGIGSIRIQGTKKPSGSKKNDSSSSKNKDSSSDTEDGGNSSGSSSAKLGNASEKEEKQSATNTGSQGEPSDDIGTSNDAYGYGYDDDYSEEYGY